MQVGELQKQTLKTAETTDISHMESLVAHPDMNQVFEKGSDPSQCPFLAEMGAAGIELYQRMQQEHQEEPSQPTMRELLAARKQKEVAAEAVVHTPEPVKESKRPAADYDKVPARQPVVMQQQVVQTAKKHEENLTSHSQDVQEVQTAHAAEEAHPNEFNEINEEAVPQPSRIPKALIVEEITPTQHIEEVISPAEQRQNTVDTQDLNESDGQSTHEAVIHGDKSDALPLPRLEQDDYTYFADEVEATENVVLLEAERSTIAIDETAEEHSSDIESEHDKLGVTEPSTGEIPGIPRHITEGGTRQFTAEITLQTIELQETVESTEEPVLLKHSEQFQHLPEPQLIRAEAIMEAVAETFVFHEKETHDELAEVATAKFDQLPAVELAQLYAELFDLLDIDTQDEAAMHSVSQHIASKIVYTRQAIHMPTHVESKVKRARAEHKYSHVRSAGGVAPQRGHLVRRLGKAILHALQHPEMPMPAIS